MVTPLVSPLVREDRGELRVVQGFDGRSGQHDRLAGSGQAVCGRLVVIDHHRTQPPVRAANGPELVAMPLAVPPRGDQHADRAPAHPGGHEECQHHPGGGQRCAARVAIACPHVMRAGGQQAAR